MPAGANSRIRTDDIKLGRLLLYQLSYVRLIGGRGEIRTHGGFLLDGFQDRCLKPLSHSPFVLALELGIEPRTNRVTVDCSTTELLQNFSFRKLTTSAFAAKIACGSH